MRFTASIVSGLGRPDYPGHFWATFCPSPVGLIHFTEYLGLTRMRSRVTISLQAQSHWWKCSCKHSTNLSGATPTIQEYALLSVLDM